MSEASIRNLELRDRTRVWGIRDGEGNFQEEAFGKVYRLALQGRVGVGGL